MNELRNFAIQFGMSQRIYFTNFFLIHNYCWRIEKLIIDGENK